MNIIFKENITDLYQKYTVLELDTFKFPDGTLHTACCVVENIPVLELPQTENLKELHANLIENYGQKNWNFCEQAIEHLMGKWGNELDSFYLEFQNRINLFKNANLDDSWTPVIIKN